MKEFQSYSTGDWIVHAYYGIGQIKGVEVKCISGEESRYYKIQATGSTYWMPVDQMDSEALRPLATSEEMQQAIDVLQEPPMEMSSNQPPSPMDVAMILLTWHSYRTTASSKG